MMSNFSNHKNVKETRLAMRDFPAQRHSHELQLAEFAAKLSQTTAPLYPADIEEPIYALCHFPNDPTRTLIFFKDDVGYTEASSTEFTHRLFFSRALMIFPTIECYKETLVANHLSKGYNISFVLQNCVLFPASGFEEGIWLNPMVIKWLDNQKHIIRVHLTSGWSLAVNLGYRSIRARAIEALKVKITFNHVYHLQPRNAESIFSFLGIDRTRFLDTCNDKIKINTLLVDHADYVKKYLQAGTRYFLFLEKSLVKEDIDQLAPSFLTK